MNWFGNLLPYLVKTYSELRWKFIIDCRPSNQIASLENFFKESNQTCANVLNVRAHVASGVTEAIDVKSTFVMIKNGPDFFIKFGQELGSYEVKNNIESKITVQGSAQKLKTFVDMVKYSFEVVNDVNFLESERKCVIVDPNTVCTDMMQDEIKHKVTATGISYTSWDATCVVGTCPGKGKIVKQKRVCQTNGNFTLDAWCI